MAVFEASFEGPAFNETSFDTDYFIENAQDIIQEHMSSDAITDNGKL